MNYVMARPLRIELTDGIYHVTSRLILFTCETRCDTVEALNALSLWLFEVESEYMPEVLFNLKFLYAPSALALVIQSLRFENGFCCLSTTGLSGSDRTRAFAWGWAWW